MAAVDEKGANSVEALWGVVTLQDFITKQTSNKVWQEPQLPESQHPNYSAPAIPVAFNLSFILIAVDDDRDNDDDGAWSGCPACLLISAHRFTCPRMGFVFEQANGA